MVIVEGGVIGQYRVLNKIGEGGMGTVYLGEHTLLGRKAAIKVLLPSLSANEDIVRRFFNEARAVTLIADPGIVQIFDFGFHTDGSAFIVMELLEGEPMDQRLARIGRFGLIEGLRLMRLICTSLGAAHAKGIIHRDLKRIVQSRLPPRVDFRFHFPRSLTARGNGKQETHRLSCPQVHQQACSCSVALAFDCDDRRLAFLRAAHARTSIALGAIETPRF